MYRIIHRLACHFGMGFPSLFSFRFFKLKKKILNRKKMGASYSIRTGTLKMSRIRLQECKQGPYNPHLIVCEYMWWLWLFRICIVCDVTWHTELSVISYIYNLKISMKNIRVLFFSFYPPYASSQEKTWSWSGY